MKANVRVNLLKVKFSKLKIHMSGIKIVAHFRPCVSLGLKYYWSNKGTAELPIAELYDSKQISYNSFNELYPFSW